jgi:hypothetical protein
MAEGYIDYGMSAVQGAPGGFDVMDFIMRNSRRSLLPGQTAPAGGQGAPAQTAPTPDQVAANLAASDQSGQALDAFVQQYRTAYDNAVANEQKRVERAGNPLNRVLSGITGIVGAPVKLLDNAIGGGNWDVTEPFRPKESAKNIADQRILAMAGQRAGFEENLAQMRSARATALKTALTDSRKDQEEALARVAGLAAETVRGDPQAWQQNWQAGLTELVQANPSLAPLARNWTNFNPALAGRLVGSYGNEGARKAWNDYTGVEATPIPENSAVILRPGNPYAQTQVVTQSSQGVTNRRPTYGVESFPAVTIGGDPAPAVAAPVDAAPAPMYEVPAANIPSGNPLDPNLANTPALSVDAIDAELRKRGVQF